MILVDTGDAKAAALKAALPAAGTGAAYALGPPAKTIFGLTLSEVAAVATIMFVALQAAYLIWKWRRDWLDRRDKRTLEAVQT